MKQKMSRAEKVACILFAIFLLMLFSIPFWGPINFFFHIRYSLKGWESGKYSKDDPSVSKMIPPKEDCSGYQKAKFYWNNNKMGSWIWDYAQYAACLELQYEEANYPAAKEKALSAYHFLEKPALDHFSLEKEGIVYIMPLTETKVGDFTVKIIDDRIDPENPWGALKDEETGEWKNNGFYTYYPSIFGFLAIHDEDHKIRFCYIKYYDLHVLQDEKSVKGYIKRNFPIGWK